MSDQSILQIDTDEELARVMRQLKTLPQQLGAPNVLKNALNSTARKVRQQIIKDSKGRYALKEKKALQSESKILSASASTLEAAVLAKGSHAGHYGLYDTAEHGHSRSGGKGPEQRGHETAGGGRPESVYYHVPIRAHRHCAAARRGTPPRQKAAFACRSPHDGKRGSESRGGGPGIRNPAA